MKSIFAKMSKGSTQRPARFIVPGELAKWCGYGQKVSKTLGECGFATKSSHGSNIDHLEEQGARYKISDRNSSNRVNGVMPHRTGSEPHRQMIFEKTCENEAPLDVAQLFYETRQRNGKLEPQAQKKYDEIVEIVKSNPSLSHIEVVEQSFGPQCHSHIFGFGGGVKRKDFNDSQAAYIKELEAKLSKKNEELHEKDAENHKLRSRFDAFESRLVRIEDTQQNEDIISTPNT